MPDMTPTKEQRDELRRLDRELSECLDLLKGSDDPAERYEMASRRADRDQAAGKVIIPLLDALEAAERERDRLREAIRSQIEAGAKHRDTGWGSQSDGYAAGRIDAAAELKAALGEQP